MSDKTATLVRTIAPAVPGASQALYSLSEPLDGHSTVVVSAIPAPFDTGRPETYIFGADESGGIVDWSELPGSFRGGMSHSEALSGAGYTIK